MSAKNSAVNTTKKMASHWPLTLLSSFSSILTLLLPLVLVRVLSPEAVGEFKVFFLYLLLLPGLSLSVGLINGLAQWCGRGEEEKVQAASFFVVILALSAALLIIAFRHQLALTLSLSEREIILFGIASFGALASTLLEEILVFKGFVWKGALLAAGSDIVRTSLLALSAFYYGTLEAVLMTHVTVISLKTIPTLSLAWRLNLNSIAPKMEVVSSIWRYAFPVSVAGVLGVLLNYADKFVLSTYISSAEFAVYAIGCLSIPPLFMLEYSATRVLIPRISSEIDKANRSGAAKLYQETVGQIAWLTIPATCGLIIFAEPIVTLLFTESYAAGATYLRLFSLSYLLLAIPYDAVARAKGDGTWILRNFAIWSGSALVISAALASKFGALGALSGAILAQLGMRIWGVNYTIKALRSSLSELFPWVQIGRYILVSAFLSLLAVASRPAFDSEISWLLISAPSFALLYFLLLYLLPKGEHTPKLKILFLTQHFEMGGLEVMIAHLVRRLAALPNFTPVIFAYDEDESAGGKGLSVTLRKEGLAVYTHKKGRGFSPVALVRLLSCIVKNQIDLIHSHDLGALMYGACAKILLLGKLRLIHTQHSFVHLNRNRRYRMCESVFSKFADEIVVLNAYSRDQYRELGVPHSKLSIIENGISVGEKLLLGTELRLRERASLFEKLLAEVATQSEAAPLRALINDRWILSLARYHPVKGQRHILDAWEKLTPEVRARTAIICLGPDVIPGELETLRERRERLPDKNRIFLFETTNHPQDWICVVDLFLSLSEYEGLPLGPLEAIALGTPVLLSEIEGHSHIKSLTEQVALGDASAVSEAISSRLKGLDDESSTLKLLHHAKEVRERYSIGATVQKYIWLYTKTNKLLVFKPSSAVTTLSPEVKAA